MTAAAGICALLSGLAFSFLAVVAVIELARRSRRGGSARRFGAAFLSITLTFAPEQVMFGLRVLKEGTPAPGPLLVTTLMVALPLLLFVGLRVEALTGERAERFIPGLPTWLPGVPLAAAMVGGGAAWVAIGHARAVGLDPVGLAGELLVALVSLAVGSVMLHAQVERRRSLGGWSLSALSLTALFPALALAHVVGGLVEPPSGAELIVTMLAIPGTLYFLWVVRRLHLAAQRVTRRRPLVGPATRATRQSPWAGAEADASLGA